MVGNKAQKAVAAALTGMLALGSVAPALAGTWIDKANNWYRIDGTHREGYSLATYDGDDAQGLDAISGTKKVAGKDRYDTMFDAIYYNITKSGVWAEGIGEVVLVSGTSQSDALVAAGYAGSLNGENGAPVITTPGDKLGTQAGRALEYFAKKCNDNGKDLVVTIIGGENAVSKSIEQEVKDLDGDYKVDRIAGEDRVETSLKVAKEMSWLEDGDATAYVANGWAWADALSVSSFAYQAGEPVLLTAQDGKLTDDEKAYLKDLSSTVNLFVVGGPAEGSVQDAYDAGFSRARVTYKGGKDRYETSALVVKEMLVSGYIKNNEVRSFAVASGNNAHWPDALIGGAFVGANDGVLVLADSDNSAALKEAKDLGLAKSGKTYDEGTFNDEIRNKFIIGGESAISERVARKIAEKF